MASGKIYGTTSNQYIDSKIEWWSVPNYSANESTVTAELYYKRNNTSHLTSGTGSFKVSIDGQSQEATRFMSIKDSWFFAASISKTISHNADGTKTITISAEGSIPNTELTSTSCSGIVNLDTIPIASTITKAKDIIYGSAFETTWTPVSSKHYYKIVFTAGSWSETTSILYPNTTSAYTYEYSLRDRGAFAKAFPNQPSVDVTATLYTYSDNGTTQVGDISSKSFVVTFTNQYLNPTAGLTLEPETPHEIFSELYLQGLSKVKATAWAQGAYGASITSQIVQIQGKEYDLGREALVHYTCTSDIIRQSGSLTVTSTVKDSRSITRIVSQSIDVIPYGKPRILPASDENIIICARCDKDGKLSNSGTYLKIKARRSYFTVTSEGEQKNFCEIRYRYRTESDADFSDWITILDKSNTATDTIDSDPIPGVVSSTATAYVVEVGVIDDVGKPDSYPFNIPTDFVVLDIPASKQGKRIGVGRYAADSSEPGIDIAMDMYFEDETIYGAFADVVDEIATHEASDTSGSWWYRKWRSGTYDICGTFTVQPSENNMYDGGGYYSNQIQIELPFDIMSLECTGTPTAQHYWLINSALVKTDNSKKIGFQLAGFLPIDTSKSVSIQLVGHGKYKT